MSSNTHNSNSTSKTAINQQKRLKEKRLQRRKKLQLDQKNISINQEMNNFSTPGSNYIDTSPGSVDFDRMRNHDLTNKVSVYLQDHQKKPSMLSKSDKEAYDIAQSIINGKTALPSNVNKDLGSSLASGKKKCKSTKLKNKQDVNKDSSKDLSSSDKNSGDNLSYVENDSHSQLKPSLDFEDYMLKSLYK